MDWLWMWVAIFLIALTLEIVTEQLIPVWFMPAALVSGIIDIFYDNIVIQSIAFVIVAAVGVFVVRPYIRRDKIRLEERGLDSVVGEKCTVTERIDTFAGCGQAKIKGEFWSARGLDENDEFEEGEVLRIVGIEGVKLICRRL